MATLNLRQKRFIVERLACLDTPSAVADAFEEAFGEQVSRQQVNNYDAGKPYARKRMAGDLVELYDDVRGRFLDAVQDVAIANKAYRLQRLDEMYRQVKRTGNFKLAADILEQAAKEMGGMYTNVRALTHETARRGPYVTGVNFEAHGLPESDPLMQLARDLGSEDATGAADP